MLRQLNQSSGGQRILGTPYIGILAEDIIAQTATGDHGPGLLYPKASLVENAGKRLRIRITILPSAGTLFVWENGKFTLTGAPDGAYVIGYEWDVEGVMAGSDMSTITVGTVNAAAPGGEGIGTGSGTGGDASGQISATAPGGEGVGSGSGSGGDATGNAAGDATAPGGEGSGTGSGSGGDATGQINASAPGGEGVGTGSGSGGNAAGGGTGTGGPLSDADIDRIVAALVPALLTALQATTIPVDVRKNNGVLITGTGVEPIYANDGTLLDPGDPWRPA